jgi:hypothetical protein
MSMHLHHPALSLNGKRKGKVKFKSAEAKRKHERLEQEWRELLKRQGAELEQKRRSRAMKAEPLTYKLSAPAGRGNTKHIPSLNSGCGVATLAPAKVYTGNEMIGVGQLHKSNAIPIFRKEDAQDLAKMRR